MKALNETCDVSLFKILIWWDDGRMDRESVWGVWGVWGVCVCVGGGGAAVSPYV